MHALCLCLPSGWVARAEQFAKTCLNCFSLDFSPFGLTAKADRLGRRPKGSASELCFCVIVLIKRNPCIFVSSVGQCSYAHAPHPSSSSPRAENKGLQCSDSWCFFYFVNGQQSTDNGLPSGCFVFVHLLAAKVRRSERKNKFT